MSTKTFSFSAERYDPLASQYFDYTVLFYVTPRKGAELEAIESKSKRRFSKRSPTPLTLSDLFLGATIVINTFQMTISRYNDSNTERALQKLHEQTLGIVQGSAFQSLGKIISAANGFGFKITKLHSIDVNAATQKALAASAGLRVQTGKAAFLALLRPDAAKEWRKLVSRFDNPDEVYGSADSDSGRLQVEQVFQSGLVTSQTSAVCSRTHSSLCLVKPHAVAAGHAGAAVQRLMEHFDVTAVEKLQLSKADALEFLTCYRGVLPEFSAQVEGLYDGPCVAVEVTDLAAMQGQTDAAGGPGVVQRLRELAGPANVVFAQCLAPDSLRAQFGVNNVDNGVHVTDLPTDGRLETNFFFKVLKT